MTNDSLPIWRVFNYLAKTWYDLPGAEMDRLYHWYQPAISFVWNHCNDQEKAKRAEVPANV